MPGSTSRATLVHSGGWKKLQDVSVGNADFKARWNRSRRITRVHNFYGMVEQVGSVFFECPAGFFHPPNFADVRVRDPRHGVARSWRDGRRRGLQPAARSYPGHALLTEDSGVVHGVDDCPCGRWVARSPSPAASPRPRSAAAATPRLSKAQPVPEPVLGSAIDDRTWSLSAFLDEVTAGDRRPLASFGEVSVSFATELSRRLFEVPGVRGWPDIVALAYSLRAAPISALARDFAALKSDEVVLVPRGLVFHVPPANVDTLFVYSWIFSMLVGNLNMVRVSEHRGETVDVILSAIWQVLDTAQFAELRARNWFVETGHVDEISAALSRLADVRAVWGGDATVTHFRQFPVPVRGHDLAFADRHSMVILDAAAVADASDEVLEELGPESSSTTRTCTTRLAAPRLDSSFGTQPIQHLCPPPVVASTTP